MGAECWVVEVLKTGYRLLFTTPPPLSDSPLYFENYSYDSPRPRALDLEVSSMLAKSALEISPLVQGFAAASLWSQNRQPVEACHRLVQPKHVSMSDSLQDGNSAVGPPGREKRTIGCAPSTSKTLPFKCQHTMVT